MSKLHLNKTGSGYKPFKTEEDAEKFLQEEMNDMGQVLSIDGGFAVMSSNKVKTEATKYFEVEVHARSGSSDPLIIPLGVNGLKYNITRGTKVVLPEPWINVAKNAVVERFEMKQGTLISMGSTSTCPITVGKEVTEEVFKKALKKGNVQRDNDISIRDAEARRKG